jgi:hypothetical protein
MRLDELIPALVIIFFLLFVGFMSFLAFFSEARFYTKEPVCIGSFCVEFKK